VNQRFQNTHRGESFEQPPSFDEEDISDKAGWAKALPSLSPEEEESILEAKEKRLRTLEGANLALQLTLAALERAGEKSYSPWMSGPETPEQLRYCVLEHCT
jgi:hypothetical protein